MSYKVKIKVYTDSDFTLLYSMPKFPYKFKSKNGMINMILYLEDDEQIVKVKLVEFLRTLSISTHKEGLKSIFEESVFQYSEELYDNGLHSNHNLLSGNYEMEVIILKETSEYL